MFDFVVKHLNNRWDLKKILKQQEIIMAKIDELSTAVSELQATADSVVVKIDELKAAAGNLDPQIDAAVGAINIVKDKLNAAIQ